MGGKCPGGQAFALPPIEDSSGTTQESAGVEDLPHLILVADPGQDLDDEMAFIMLRHLVALGMVDVQGIIATLTPSFDRARLVKGTLAALGLHSVPIGLGSDGGDIQGVHKASTFEQWAKPYMPPRHSSVFEPARSLLHRLYQEAEPKSLTLVIIASLKDPALFLREEEELFQAKTREVIIMGGVEPWQNDQEGVVLKPDSAHNQMFDKAASTFFFERCQQINVPLVVVSRWAAYSSKVQRSCYDDLAALGSWVGCRLRNAQRTSIESLWNRACGTGGEREGLPDRCDREWFLKTFCNNASAAGRNRGDTIWDLVVGFMQYDTIATMAAVPALRAQFFSPIVVPGQNGTRHIVIGRSETDHNVCDPVGLTKFLSNGFINGLSLNNRRRVQFILLSQPKWNNECEELLACVVLRTLFEMGILDCVGIVLSPGPPSTEAPSGREALDALAKELLVMLKLLGLSHVPVNVSQSYTAESGKVSGADHLNAIYKRVSPAGITLIVTGSLGEVADFAESQPSSFQQKTQNIIILGGAFPGPERNAAGVLTGGTTLVPDEAAQNIKVDMPGAIRFFIKAQELLVPMIVISRHCAAAVPLPRTYFDSLANDGGVIGKKLKDVQSSCIMKLWAAASAEEEDDDMAMDGSKGAGYGRRGLPKRCDEKWFVDTFCRGNTPDRTKGEAGLWEQVSSFNVYSLLAVLMALPPFLNRYGKGASTTVRSAKHQIIGLTKEDHGITDVKAVKDLIFQCLSSGVLLNTSRFNSGKDSHEVEHTFNSQISADVAGQLWNPGSHREALSWMLPGKPGQADLWS